jgi:hypothetical protein
MPQARFDEAGFLTTLAREFAAVINQCGDFNASGQDCLSAIADVIPSPLRSETLRNLAQADLVAMAASLNAFFETQTITAAHMAQAVSATLWHWPGSTT